MSQVAENSDRHDFDAEAEEILKFTASALLKNITFAISNQHPTVSNVYFDVDSSSQSHVVATDDQGRVVEEASQHAAMASLLIDRHLKSGLPSEAERYINGTRVNYAGQVFFSGDSSPKVKR